MTACTAAFQESSAVIGDTIHADFTWADATQHPTLLIYATMSIINPSGTYVQTFLEFINPTSSQTLSYVTDEVGIWTAKIQVWSVAYWVTCTGTISVTAQPPPPTGSLVFREGAAVVVGTTIHADCMWQNAAPGGSYYATMKIDDPNFDICDYHNETQNATGAHTLSCVTDMVGTWIAELKIWDGTGWVGLYETIQVTTANAPTAIIDEPLDGATVNNPVYFEGHGVSNAGGQILYYAWFDGGNQISEEPSFITNLSPGQHDIGFVVFCSIGGWSEYVWINITVGEQISCWECLNPGSPCELTTGHTICDGVTTFSTKAACENATACFTPGPVDCWECQTPGSPCVQTAGHTSCNGITTFDTKAGCEASTGCESNGDGCESYLNQSECETAGCYWYAKYIWEAPSCHGTEQNMIMDYLPFIIAGAGGVIILAALFSKPKPTYIPKPQPKYSTY